MISEKILKNQALNAHALFFDPVNKDLVLRTDENGNPAGKYVDKPQGVVVDQEGTAHFSFLAPNAKKVEVAGIGGTFSNVRHEMHQDADQVWRVSIPGIGPGFHYHEYFVDGNRVCSDLAPYGYGCSRNINFFEMPDENSDFYLLQDVPHGTIRMNYYKSSVTGRMRNCFVYTPPGYETSPDKRYPVLYLQHGGGESETGWIWQGKINYIADNLLAQGQCREMIIVMNSGYSFPLTGDAHPARGCIDEVLVQDCIPFIDQTYRTIPDRRSRAMAGLSMGGFQTQATVLGHPDVFSSLGMFSAMLIINDGVEDYSAVFADKDQFCHSFDLFFVSAGQQETDVCQGNLRAVEELRRGGIPVTFFTTPGYHEWQVWRYSAREFLKLVFQTPDEK